MKALVTGSSGFLGRHFVHALRERDYEVTEVDVRRPLGLRRIDIRLFDARDYFRHSSDRFDLAVHCAAVVGGRQKIEGAPLELAVDLSLDAELFGWAARTRPGRVVYVSSSAAYPIWLQGPNVPGLPVRLRECDLDIEEIATVRRPLPAFPIPDLLYGWTKLTGELLAHHARESGVQVTVVRPFSGYGADQGECYPFRAFLERAARREDPFTVWGDGEQVRDFIHVDDLVGGTLALVDQSIDGPVNLGTGRPTSFNELARMVCAAAGYEPRLRHEADAPTGVRYRVADPTLLLRHYGPRVRLEEGIEVALRATVGTR